MKVIEHFEKGECTADIQHSYDLHEATECIICTSAEEIKDSFKCAIPIRSTIMHHKGLSIAEKMERLTLLQIEHQNPNMSLSLLVMKEKGRNLYEEAGRDEPDMQTFVSSSVLFDQFRRHGIELYMRITGEAAYLEAAHEVFISIMEDVNVAVPSKG